VTTVVLDASLIVKWIFADRAEESHSLQALQILQFIRKSRISGRSAATLACRGGSGHCAFGSSMCSSGCFALARP